MDILNQIREVAYKAAFSEGLLVGQSNEKIEWPFDLVNGMADRIVDDFYDNNEITTIESIRKDLIRGFVYMFDKGIEITYYTRIQTDTQIEYNFGHLMNGLGADTVPEYIQTKVTSKIAVLAEIYQTIMEYIKQHNKQLEKEDISTEQLMKLVLVGGASFGLEFCLRLELE
jgi:hypothetical protein